MMRRLISMLAAGVLAAGTLFATAGVASAGAAAARKAPCTPDGSGHITITVSGVNFHVGTPNTTFNGATVRLKPRFNSTTLWTGCFTSAGDVVLFNRGLAMTSRSFSPGATVTVQTAPAGGGFLSQQWIIGSGPGGTTTFQNAKTGLFLRVRNSCCFFGQTVTTGSTPTDWTIN
jgi:hypothetical protein